MDRTFKVDLFVFAQVELIYFMGEKVRVGPMCNMTCHIASAGCTPSVPVFGDRDFRGQLWLCGVVRMES